jgi:hypothetical protein
VSGTLDDDNQSFSDIDTSTGQFCLVGLVQGTDSSAVPGRTVSFEYRSNGSVDKANPKRVTGDFATVDLTLTIQGTTAALAGCGEANPDPEDDDGDGIVEPGEQNCEFQRQVSSACKLKGRLNKAGDQSKARLKCDLGENLAALGLNEPANAEFLDNVEVAFPKAGQKHVKINTKKGKLRVTHNGAPAPANVPVSLSCTPVSNGD